MVLVSGCGGSNDGDGADMAVGADMATSADLSVLHDLAPPSSDGAVACAPLGGGTTAQYVFNQVTVPQQRSDYAIDLNGDGRVDNQLGNIIGALSAQAVPVQTQMDGAIASGQSITLLDERSADASFTSDGCAASDLYAGTAMASPDYSGNGHFTVDATATAGHYSGPIVTSRFTSQPSPAVAEVGVTAHAMVPIFGPVPVDLVGTRITYVRSGTGVMMGQLNGAIRNQDVQTKVVPNLAAAFNQQIASNPSSSTSMQLLAIFDNGGKANPACAAGTCKNLDGSCAVKGDNVISDCEVSSSGLIQNVLAPDVQMFDSAGNYRPNPANTNKDSLSVAFGFTAVRATF
jgi:hypothetical protein